MPTDTNNKKKPADYQGDRSPYDPRSWPRYKTILVPRRDTDSPYEPCGFKEVRIRVR